MSVPPFRSDGYLPEGVHIATVEEITARFGSSTVRRKYLMTRLARWIQLGRAVGALRILIDGSFVTAKVEPNDVDAVIQLTDRFHLDFSRGTSEAVELYGMIVNKEPEEIYAAEDAETWLAWVEFFSHLRENQSARKGLVEVRL